MKAKVMKKRKRKWMMLGRRLEQEDKLRDGKQADSESEIPVVDLVSSADDEAVMDWFPQ